MVNNYFKVNGKVDLIFFFDRQSKLSTASAWTLAVTAAHHECDLHKGLTDKPEQLIAFWARPTEPGPWAAACLIGDRSPLAKDLPADLD